jgi:hypothetical protein
MGSRRRIHDGIVAIFISAGVAAGSWMDPVWLAISGAIGVLMIQSWITGFCPVYFTLYLLGIDERQVSAPLRATRARPRRAVSSGPGTPG